MDLFLAAVAFLAGAAVLCMDLAMAVGSYRSQPGRKEKRGAVEVTPAERGDLL